MAEVALRFPGGGCPEKARGNPASLSGVEDEADGAAAASSAKVLLGEWLDFPQ